MKIQLTKTVMEGANPKITYRPNRSEVTAWVEGTVMLVSDATGEKLIAQGVAKVYEEPDQNEEQE